MSSVWDERGEIYRQSEAHREGADLDLVVAWSRGARTALDVATGGGHVARRLREEGIEVTSCDPSPAMRPDVVCRAEQLPFPDRRFDVVACRLAAHHFESVAAAVRELARVSDDRVLVVDTLYAGEAEEEAERLRDPSHVRDYSESEWRGLLEGAGLRVEEVRVTDGSLDFGAWLERSGCEGEAAARVGELLAGRMEGDRVRFERICFRARRVPA